jgi:hypothetical protein
MQKTSFQAQGSGFSRTCPLSHMSSSVCYGKTEKRSGAIYLRSHLSCGVSGDSITESAEHRDEIVIREGTPGAVTGEAGRELARAAARRVAAGGKLALGGGRGLRPQCSVSWFLLPVTANCCQSPPRNYLCFAIYVVPRWVNSVYTCLHL